jgi:hypothetical protein
MQNFNRGKIAQKYTNKKMPKVNNRPIGSPNLVALARDQREVF